MLVCSGINKGTLKNCCLKFLCSITYSIMLVHKEILAFQWSLWSALHVKWCFPYCVVFNQSMLLWPLAWSCFSQTGKSEKPYFLHNFASTWNQHKPVLPLVVAPSLVPVQVLVQPHRNWVGDLVWFWWTLRNFYFVLAVVMSLGLFSAKLCKLLCWHKAEGSTSGSIQWWFILDRFKVSMKQYCY